MDGKPPGELKFINAVRFLVPRIEKVICSICVMFFLVVDSVFSLAARDIDYVVGELEPHRLSADLLHDRRRGGCSAPWGDGDG